MPSTTLAQDEHHLQTYLSAQITGLHNLLDKLTGSSTTSKVEHTLMENAHRRGWQVSLADGMLSYDGPFPSVDAYTSLLDQFVSSVIGILGKKMVVDEMHRIDQGAGPDVRRSADRAGLTTVFIKYL